MAVYRLPLIPPHLTSKDVSILLFWSLVHCPSLYGILPHCSPSIHNTGDGPRRAGGSGLCVAAYVIAFSPDPAAECTCTYSRNSSTTCLTRNSSFCPHTCFSFCLNVSWVSDNILINLLADVKTCRTTPSPVSFSVIQQQFPGQSHSVQMVLNSIWGLMAPKCIPPVWSIVTGKSLFNTSTWPFRRQSILNIFYHNSSSTALPHICIGHCLPLAGQKVSSHTGHLFLLFTFIPSANPIICASSPNLNPTTDHLPSSCPSPSHLFLPATADWLDHLIPPVPCLTERHTGAREGFWKGNNLHPSPV